MLDYSNITVKGIVFHNKNNIKNPTKKIGFYAKIKAKESVYSRAKVNSFVMRGNACVYSLLFE